MLYVLSQYFSVPDSNVWILDENMQFSDFTDMASIDVTDVIYLVAMAAPIQIGFIILENIL